MICRAVSGGGGRRRREQHGAAGWVWPGWSWWVEGVEQSPLASRSQPNSAQYPRQLTASLHSSSTQALCCFPRLLPPLLIALQLERGAGLGSEVIQQPPWREQAGASLPAVQGRCRQAQSPQPNWRTSVRGAGRECSNAWCQDLEQVPQTSIGTQC